MHAAATPLASRAPQENEVIALCDKAKEILMEEVKEYKNQTMKQFYHFLHLGTHVLMYTVKNSPAPQIPSTWSCP